jgi:large subunit ribosomal protein L9
MKVILVEDVANLGKIGDTVEVKNGYARNFLIPRNLAIVASSRNIKAQQHQLQAIEKKVAKVISDAQTLSEKLSGASVTFTRKAGDTGKLFGSVTNMDITDELANDGITLDRKDVLLEEPIKELGDFEVSVKLPHEVSATIKVTVIGETEEGAEGETE